MGGGIIVAIHSTHGVLGKDTSPLIVQDVWVEGPASSVLQLANGYAQLDNKAPWMATNGCTGNFNMIVRDLDLSRVTSFRHPSVVLGCNLDDSDPTIPNADCVCTTNQGCNDDEHMCRTSVQLESFVDPAASVDFLQSIMEGDNVNITLPT